MWLVSTLLMYLSIDIVKSTVDYLQNPVRSCHIGDTVENECNKCLCTSKTMFECTPLDCNKNKTSKEFQDTKQCYPNQPYVQNLITCICTKYGRWPHKSCYDTFQSLPPSKVIKHKCEPDSYVSIDCNVCRCGPDGEITDRCTRNSCEDEIQRRANFGSNSVYSNCEVKNWYSLAPCQFCFCVQQNKLVCNTGNYYSKKLELGSYNLMICGKDMIREAIELIPDSQKMLRYGLGLGYTSTTTMQRESTEFTTNGFANVRDDQNVAIELNRETNENKTIFDTSKLDNSSSSSEYYTNSEEEQQNQEKIQGAPKPTVKATTTTDSKGLSTKFPIMLDESDVKLDEDNKGDSSEMEVELDQILETPTDTLELQALSDVQAIPEIAKDVNSAESYQYVGNT